MGFDIPITTWQQRAQVIPRPPLPCDDAEVVNHAYAPPPSRRPLPHGLSLTLRRLYAPPPPHSPAFTLGLHPPAAPLLPTR